MSPPQLIASLLRPARASRRRPGAAGHRPRLEALEGRQLMTTWAYDFGTPTSPVAAGYTRVHERTRYTATLGYGLSTGVVQSRDRLVGDAAKRDLLMSEGGYLSFVRDLPSGMYDVTLTMGDALYAHTGQSVWLEGTRVDVVTTARGEFLERTYRLPVTDGRLMLELRTANGSRSVYVNAIRVTSIDEPPPPPPPPRDPAPGALYVFDFGPAGSYVEAGYTLLTETARYDTTRGYGWTTSGTQTRDRGVGTFLARDFAMTETGRLGFAANVPDGSYDVELTIGDAHYARSEEVWIEGSRVETVTAPKNQPAERIFRTTVTDGRLDVEVRGVNGSGSVLLNGLVITPRADNTTLLEEGFEDADLPSRGWYDGSAYVLGDGTDGTRAIQYSFNQGIEVAYDSEVARHRFAGTQTVYLSFDLKLSDNWQWANRNAGPHLFYFLTNADTAFKGPAATHLTLYVGPADGKLRLIAQDISNATMPHGMTQGTTTANNGRYYTSQNVVIQPGRWHRVEAMFTLNSLDIANDRPNPDGVLRGWVDGQLLVERTDLVFRTTDFPEMKINQLLIGPYFHYGVPQNQQLWIDNVTVATAPPASSTLMTGLPTPTLEESLSANYPEPAGLRVGLGSVPSGPHADAMAGISRLGYGIGGWTGIGTDTIATPRRRPSARLLPRLTARA